MKNLILVYTGPGVAPGVKYVLDILNRTTSTYYRIKEASPFMLKNEPWEINTTLLVMPGGRATPYLEELKEEGNDKLWDFVNGGGSYLGIGAGGYYGSSHVTFGKNTSLEIERDMPLKFFPGTCEGPTFPGFDYESDNGAKAAILKVNDNNTTKYFKTYFNGGGHFVNSTQFENVTNLAYYDEKQDDNAAIVLSKVGNGTVILTGVHLEANVPSNHFLYEDLEPYIDDQEYFFSNLLEKLGIQLK